MPDTLPLVQSPLDVLLAPYEARKPSASGLESDERRRALALGDELNRIQGAQCQPAIERLGLIWSTGRINRKEYVELVGQLGRAGLLHNQEMPLGV